MSSQQKLKFCANLSMMYAKEAPSLLDRYTLAKSFGFKGVECAFPYEFSKEDLIKVTNLRLWSFMLLTYLLDTFQDFFDCLAHPNLSATFATDQK